MLKQLWAVLKQHMVTAISDDKAACLDCRALLCSGRPYDLCPRRQERARVLAVVRSKQRRP